MRIALLVLLAVPPATLAETAYVTDNLRLGIHQAENTSDRAFRTLESGQELEILSRDRNYAHVQLPDGTVGNVKVAYLVFEKPAKLIVAETHAANAALQKELADLKRAFAAPAATIAALEQKLADGQASLDESSARNLQLSSENENYRKRHDQFKHSLPFSWVAGASGVCLLVGFLGGLWWIDQRSRKRHGGVRLY
jgi:SH3 domain protein